MVADVAKAPDGAMCDQCPGLGRTGAALMAVSLSAGLPPRFLCGACSIGTCITLCLLGYELRF